VFIEVEANGGPRAYHCEVAVVSSIAAFVARLPPWVRSGAPPGGLGLFVPAFCWAWYALFHHSLQIHTTPITHTKTNKPKTKTNQRPAFLRNYVPSDADFKYLCRLGLNVLADTLVASWANARSYHRELVGIPTFQVCRDVNGDVSAYETGFDLSGATAFV
jgi:hypothetical protein